jgi:hypothetical protein
MTIQHDLAIKPVVYFVSIAVHGTIRTTNHKSKVIALVKGQIQLNTSEVRVVTDYPQSTWTLPAKS